MFDIALFNADANAAVRKINAGIINTDCTSSVLGHMRGIFTMKATWQPNEYTIKYFTNGGTLDDTVSTTYTIESETFDLPTPVRSGFEFMGWCDNSRLTSNCSRTRKISKGSIGNKTFYAKWKFVCESDKWLYFKDEKVCLSANQNTHPAMAVDIAGVTYYANLSKDNNLPAHKDSNKKIRIKIGGQVYNLYDNSVNQ